MPDPALRPSGATVDAIDWLRSGTRSGLVRVRGRRTGDVPFELPELVLDGRRFASLPDPRADRDRSGWRGAYVVDAAVAAAAAEWLLEWPGAAPVPIARPEVPAASVAAEAPPVEEPGGDVVDRAVLAERRARRAEAAEQAQARIAQEALRAVEVLELRAAEVEERLAEAMAERDALRGRLERDTVAPEPGPAPVAEMEALRAELARRDAEPPPTPPLGDPDRRVVRLREALTATVATVADLRMQLHEAQVQRRTRELEWSAEAVRLAVLEREHAEVTAALEAAREELGAAEEARSAAERAASALAAREAELTAASQRVAVLEAEVAEVRERLDGVGAELAAARQRTAEVEAAADARVAVATAEAGARAAAAEEAAAVAEGRLVHALVSIDEAETARELAEARALAAEAARHAAAVAAAAQRRGAEAPAPAAADAARAAATPTGAPPALAAGGWAPPVPHAAPAPSAEPFDTAQARLRAAAAPAGDAGPLPPAAPEVLDAGTQQAHAAAADRPATDPQRVVADLDTAARTLRRRAAAGDRPPLAPALVRLAQDDPSAAAALIAGLLPAQHLLLAEPLDYDLTIREGGTYAVRCGADATTVEPLAGPRGRQGAAFHLRTDAATAARWLAGTGPEGRLRRFGGPARVSGAVRRARALEPTRGAALDLARAVRAGATVDPALALRALAHLVDPAWTVGHAFVAEVAVGNSSTAVWVTDGGGLQVTTDLPPGEAHVRLRLTPEAYAALLAGDPDGAHVAVEGSSDAAAALRGWIDRVLGA